jgi:hypothetical protein
MPVAVLIAGWFLGIEPVDFKKLGNVSLIVVGVVLASFGEIDFVLIGFLYQLGGIAFEAVRICMVQRLLNGSEFKMDPLVSLYYFAPVCAVMNLTIAMIWELPKVTMAEVYAVGLGTFFGNACCAFLLNVSVVFLVSPQHPRIYIYSLTKISRSERHPASSSLFAVSSKISFSLSHLFLSGELRSLVSRSSDTVLPFAACFTTSLARRSLSHTLRKPAADGPSSAPHGQFSES